MGRLMRQQPEPQIYSLEGKFRWEDWALARAEFGLVEQ